MTMSDVCSNCNGTGLDQTWHEGATCAEIHGCNYCQGGTYSGEPPAHLLDADGDPFIERGPDRFQVPHARPEHNAYTLDWIIWWWGLAPDESIPEDERDD